MDYQKRINKKKNKIKWIILILILFAIASLWNQEIIQDYLAGNPIFGGGVSNSLESQTMSSLVFEKINLAREEKAINKLIYDKNSYNLAVAISKKFYNSNIYSINQSTLENMGEIYGLNNIQLLSKKLANLEEGEFNMLILDWTTRDIFKDKSLNDTYNLGAVGCYKEVCVLVISIKVEPITEIVDNQIDFNEEENKDLEINSPFQPIIDINSLEIEIHSLINIERINNGISALSFDTELSSIAREHSQDMSNNNFFDHYNLIGQDPTDRANSAGYSCYKNYGSYYTEGIAENIFQNNLYDSVTYMPIPIHDWNSQSEIAESTVQGWMNSPGHRENILTREYNKEGIGISISSDDKVYITENFC